MKERGNLRSLSLKVILYIPMGPLNGYIRDIYILSLKFRETSNAFFSSSKIIFVYMNYLFVTLFIQVPSWILLIFSLVHIATTLSLRIEQ